MFTWKIPHSYNSSFVRYDKTIKYNIHFKVSVDFLLFFMSQTNCLELSRLSYSALRSVKSLLCTSTPVNLKEHIGSLASCFADAHYKVNLSASTLGELASEASPLAFNESLLFSWELLMGGPERGEKRTRRRKKREHERKEERSGKGALLVKPRDLCPVINKQLGGLKVEESAFSSLRPKLFATSNWYFFAVHECYEK